MEALCTRYGIYGHSSRGLRCLGKWLFVSFRVWLLKIGIEGSIENLEDGFEKYMKGSLRDGVRSAVASDGSRDHTGLE